MDSPAQIVKSTLNAGNLIKFVLASVAVFALLNLLGWTDLILYPVDFIKAKFAKPAATA
jgi:membrane-associated protease RseP (regulator of RpoE activity)